MTQLSRERIEQYISDPLEYGLTRSEQMEMARRLLAAEAQEPVPLFKPVADLYEMQFDDGRTCAFHTDPAKAVQWLATCDGNKVQQYVKLERYQQAMATAQHPGVMSDSVPSFGAMMRALDAFYADEDVPENAMLAAFKILVADVHAQAAQQQEVNFTETVGGQ
jgi:hypothetical protein